MKQENLCHASWYKLWLSGAFSFWGQKTYERLTYKVGGIPLWVHVSRPGNWQKTYQILGKILRTGV